MEVQEGVSSSNEKENPTEAAEKKDAPECSPESKKRILELSEISVALDSYDDIFSDFDPRDYSKRGLSEDFINEVKKASRAKPTGGLELKILIPENLRNKSHEHVIKDRLKHYFSHHHTLFEKETRSTITRGFYFIILGLILMMIATVIKFTYGQSNLTMDFFIILLEPGGWFLFWEGLNILLLESRKMKPELEFHKKLASSEIEFVTY
jgi:hypothetical protein